MAAAAAGAVAPAEASTGVTLQHRHVFGLKADVRYNVHYADESQLIYPSGTNTILWIAEQKQQKFFQGNEGADGITCLATNPTKRYLAVAEKCSTGAIVTIFDLVTTKKRKTLQFSECDAQEFVCIAFSYDSKYLLTQTGPSKDGTSDWTLIYWQWDKARPMASMQVSNAQHAPIRDCSFSPTDSSICCVIGDGIFKFFQQKENGLKQLPGGPESVPSLLCHSWLSDNKLLVCAESGDLWLFDEVGEFISVLECSPGEPKSATCAVAFSKGFVTGGDDGLIRVFEKSEEGKEAFRRTKTIRIDGINGSPTPAVRSLALSPSEENLAVTTSNAQLYQLSLLGQDLLKAEEAPVFEPVLTPFHTGPILGMDVCTRKPLVVTCGMDKSVRIWNYLEKTCELCKFFNEEAYSVAFHPSGFHLIIGFSDKLRLMNLLMEDMKTYKDIAIKACREVRFSNGGQYFAAVSANTIQVFRTYTCEMIETLRGHNNKVRSVAWTADDSMLVSTGQDGAVYEYSILQEGRRVGQDFVLKNVNFSCVIVYTDPSTSTNTMYVVGNDEMLQEVSAGTRQNTLKAGTTLGQIVLSNNAKTLFAGVAHQDAPGAIRAYKFPLDGYYNEFTAHAAPCTRIRITFDDYYLFSTSEDGCLFIFDVKKKDRVVSKRDKENVLPPSDEILVTRTFLDEKQAQLLELERQVEELSNQIEFHLRHRESFHKEEMVELEEKYSAEIEQERTKYELLREEKNDAEMESDEHKKSLMELHGKQTQELEGSFQHKMMIEVNRYQKLFAEREAIHKYWEEQHDDIMGNHRRKVDRMQQEFESKQTSDKNNIHRIMEEKKLAENVHQETMLQLEQDTDREIEEMKEEKLKKLKDERDDKVRLRGLSGIHRRNHDDLKRQMAKKEEELRQFTEEARKKQEKIDSLEKEKMHNLKEIRERDKQIGEKEGRIYDLKKQNQELEKFKFVLDYKIKELKAQIDPKNDSIAEMKKQIQAMDSDLEDYHKKNKQLQVNITQLTSKQKVLQDEIIEQRRRMLESTTIIKRLSTDLHESVQHIQEPKQLRDAVSALYKKYVPHGVKKQELDGDIQREYNRQRDYLEKSVESLKRKLMKDSDVHKQDNKRILQENVALIREINGLRMKIDILKRERQQQKISMQSMTSKPGKSSQNMSVDAQASKEIEANRSLIEDLQRQIEEQRTLRETYLGQQSSVFSAEESQEPRALAAA